MKRRRIRRHASTRSVFYGWSKPDGRGYTVRGVFDELAMERLLAAARSRGVVAEYDTGRGAVVWFSGRPGLELRVLALLPPCCAVGEPRTKFAMNRSARLHLLASLERAGAPLVVLKAPSFHGTDALRAALLDALRAALLEGWAVLPAQSTVTFLELQPLVRVVAGKGGRRKRGVRPPSGHRVSLAWSGRSR